MSENGYELTLQAISSLKDTAAIDETALAVCHFGETGDQTPSAEALEKAGQVVQENTGALELAREGFRHEFHVPDQSVPVVLNGFKRIAELLTLDGIQKEARGDSAAAIAAYLDIVELGAVIPHGPFFFALVGRVTQSIGKKHAWRIVDKLDTRAASSQGRRIIEIQSKRITHAGVVRREVEEIAKRAESAVTEPFWRWKLFRRLTSSKAGMVQALAIVFQTRQDQLARAVSHGFDDIVLGAEQPFDASKQDFWIVEDKLANAFNSYRSFPFIISRFLWEYEGTSTLLLAVTLGLQAYRADLGSYPETLNDLSPGYLDSLPLDPFALGQGFHYRRTEDRYLLYSVGPDGVDDGGVSVDFDDQGLISRESKGDIVARDIKPIHKPKQLSQSEREEVIRQCQEYFRNAPLPNGSPR